MLQFHQNIFISWAKYLDESDFFKNVLKKELDLVKQCVVGMNFSDQNVLKARLNEIFINEIKLISNLKPMEH